MNDITRKDEIYIKQETLIKSLDLETLEEIEIIRKICDLEIEAFKIDIHWEE